MSAVIEFLSGQDKSFQRYCKVRLFPLLPENGRQVGYRFRISLMFTWRFVVLCVKCKFCTLQDYDLHHILFTLNDLRWWVRPVDSSEHKQLLIMFRLMSGRIVLGKRRFFQWWKSLINHCLETNHQYFVSVQWFERPCYEAEM